MLSGISGEIELILYIICEIYWNSLQTVVQLVWEWLSTNERPKNPVVFKFRGLDVWVSFHYIQEAQRRMWKCRERKNLLARARESRQRERASFLLLSSSSRLPEESVVQIECYLPTLKIRLEVGFPTSKII